MHGNIYTNSFPEVILILSLHAPKYCHYIQNEVIAVKFFVLRKCYVELDVENPVLGTVLNSALFISPFAV
jgi:hypothetical protein